MRPLNLASNPFRNETLPRLLALLSWIVLAGVTAQHGRVLVRLRRVPAALASEAARLEAESVQLRRSAREATPLRPEAAVVAEWTLVKDLIDRRLLSWSELLLRFEEVLPADVRLTSITPSLRRGEIHLDVSATARSTQAGRDFIRALESRPAFSNVVPLAESGADEREFQYRMEYRPGVGGAASPGTVGGD